MKKNHSELVDPHVAKGDTTLVYKVNSSNCFA